MAEILLDISRTISRASMPLPTGIDRVELAYIEHFLGSDTPVWFLSRVLKGYALLDRKAMQLVWPMITGEVKWQKKDLIARFFSPKHSDPLKRAESSLRRVSKATCSRPALANVLKKHLRPGFTYINVGHSNRKASLWQAIGAAGAGLKLAMVHDVIPLDFPEFTRPDTTKRFEEELNATARACDVLIYNTKETALRTSVWLDKWGAQPSSLPILLGVDPLSAQKASTLARPAEFVVLGTIEPRKNHQVLLDIWSEIPAHLHIVGQRGWRNEAVFDQLDSSPLIGTTVFEHGRLDDEALAARLASARALLFPSFAEGFGYPLVEALQMGIPVICSDLPCFREIAGDLPTYLAPDDKTGWQTAILAAAASPREQIPENVSFPTWEQHFAKLEDYLYNQSTHQNKQAGK